jgi:hypothetical protein
MIIQRNQKDEFLSVEDLADELAGKQTAQYINTVRYYIGQRATHFQVITDAGKVPDRDHYVVQYDD